MKSSSTSSREDNAKSPQSYSQHSQSLLLRLWKMPQIQIALGSILISFSAVFVKLTTTGPMIDGFYRMLIGGIGLVIVGLWRKQSFFQDRVALSYSLLAGAIFAADLAFWHEGIETTGPGLATIIINLQVFILAILGLVFYRDKVNKRYFLALPLAVVGLYLLIGNKWTVLGSAYQEGVVLCLIAAVMYTFYIILLRKSQHIARPTEPLPNLALICLSSALVLGLLAWYSGETFISHVPADWLWLFLYAISAQMTGWLLITRGLAHTKISQAGFLLLFQPALSLVWDILFFDRPTPPIELLGAGITLVAIYLSSTSRQ